jgi:predicted RNase H-like nuclease (RuvC/YqgF family)
VVVIANGRGRGPKSEETAPVTKVVNLLTDLKAKVASDGKAEEQMYNKYACWCEKTAKRKAGDITSAEQDLRALGQQILSLKGKVATLAAEINELGEQIEDNENQQAEATSMREKRNAEYMAASSETKQALAALTSAIKVLVKGTGLLQTDTDLATQSTMAVASVLDALPSNAQIKRDDVSFLGDFVSNGAGDNYAPQSATIQGILTDMYTTFANNLEEATSTEANQNMHFEKILATMLK